jgi:hypothetical protein
VQQAITFSPGGERTAGARHIDARRLVGRVAGGLIGGLMAWPYASIIGAMTHLHWMGAAGALGAAISLIAALGSVDRERPAAHGQKGA